MYFFIVQIHNYAVVDLVCFSREVKLSPWFFRLFRNKIVAALALIRINQIFRYCNQTVLSRCKRPRLDKLCFSGAYERVCS